MHLLSKEAGSFAGGVRRERKASCGARAQHRSPLPPPPAPPSSPRRILGRRPPGLVVFRGGGTAEAREERDFIALAQRDAADWLGDLWYCGPAVCEGTAEMALAGFVWLLGLPLPGLSPFSHSGLG